jgi:hypothetical protein
VCYGLYGEKKLIIPLSDDYPLNILSAPTGFIHALEKKLPDCFPWEALPFTM